MKVRTRIGLLVLMCLLMGTGYWFHQNVERYTRQINTGPKLDVAINPWFAAQTFLQQHDIETHRAMDLHDMLHRLNPNDALVLFNDTPIYDANHQQALKEWMHQGGHLVLAANYTWDEANGTSDDAFLDDMGVRLIWLNADEGEAEPSTVDDKNAASEEDNLRDDEPGSATGDATKDCEIYVGMDPFQIDYADGATPLRVSFGYRYTLEDASTEVTRTSNHQPNGLLEYSVGQGRMSVVLDTDIWTNPVIGNFDHAFFLWQLVGGSPVVWFVANHDSENLLAALWRTAPYLLIGIATVLLLWGWRRWVRFGPLIPDPSPSRRQLLEHIQASALFSWRHHQIEPMLKTLRDDIWLQLSRHHGVEHNANESPIAVLNKLANIIQQPRDWVQHAMTCPPPQREANWIELISQLQTIRNAL